MSSDTPVGSIPFLLNLILKNGVCGGKTCSRYGAGELLIIFSLKVCVLFASKPANFTIEGLA